MEELRNYLRRYLDRLEQELQHDDSTLDTDQLKLLLITAEETERHRLTLSVNDYDREYVTLKTILENKVKENLQILKQFESELGLESL